MESIEKSDVVDAVRCQSYKGGRSFLTVVVGDVRRLLAANGLGPRDGDSSGVTLSGTGASLSVGRGS